MAGLQGVGCEVCHGPGSKYKSKQKMEAIFYGDIDGKKIGYSVPSEETCIQCHNENSPNFEGFNFEETIHEIQHPYPDGFRESKIAK